MTIAERRHLALLEHQHRQLTQACKRLTLAGKVHVTFTTQAELNRADQEYTKALHEIEALLAKWELLE